MATSHDSCFLSRFAHLNHGDDTYCTWRAMACAIPDGPGQLNSRRQDNSVWAIHTGCQEKGGEGL